MKKQQLEQFAAELAENTIKIFLQTKAGKWYESEYSSNFDEIELNSVYGVCVGGNIIDFDFKTGKKEDNILKTFVTQYINKYEIKRTVLLEDGTIGQRTKKQVLEHFKNKDRVHKYYFYTTLYGIGCFVFFMNKKSFISINSGMGKYLIKNGVEFTTEFSEARWVYRFVINKKVEFHNKLLEEFKI